MRGSTVAVARDGAEAAAALEHGQTDLWLFDYHLDDGDTGVARMWRLQ